MATIIPFIATLWLTVSPPIRAEITYPATVEIDVLFPQNKTYNDIPSFPVVFAIQNAEAAYAWSYSITWNLDPVGGNSPQFHPTGPTIWSSPAQNDFQYYFDDVAIAPSALDDFVQLEDRQYRLEWSYNSMTCMNSANGPDASTIEVADGEVWFTVVRDGSGSDFEMEVGGECPESFGRFSASEATEASFCPFLMETVGEGEPCKGRLKSERQVECLRDYFGGDNETEACTESFKTVDPGWGVQAQDEPDTSGLGDVVDDDDDDGDEEEEDEDVEGDSPEDFGLAPPDDDSEGGGDEDMAVHYRPWMPVLLLGGCAVTWINL